MMLFKIEVDLSSLAMLTYMVVSGGTKSSRSIPDVAQEVLNM